MPDSSLVLVEQRGPVALVSLNRPERLNAWGQALSARTVEVLRELEATDDVRAVVLTGAGRAFCSGADLKEPETHHVDDPDRHLAAHQGSPIFDTLGRYSKPVMAAVNGYAIGVGCLMCACCDFIYASEQASFALPQVSLGILPAYAGTLRLARWMGRGNALHLALTGRRLPAAEAQRMGLVQEVLPPDEVIPRALETMQAIAAMPAHAVRLARESLRLGYESGLPQAEQADHYRQMMLYQTKASAEQHTGWR